VLENERPHRIRMALGTNRELTGGSSHLVAGLGAVRIVAVAALDESGVNPVPIGPRELRLLRGHGSCNTRQSAVSSAENDVGSRVGL